VGRKGEAGDLVQRRRGGGSSLAGKHGRDAGVRRDLAISGERMDIAPGVHQPDAMIAAIADVDGAAGIHDQGGRRIEQGGSRRTSVAAETANGSSGEEGNVAVRRHSAYLVKAGIGDIEAAVG